MDALEVVDKSAQWNISLQTIAAISTSYPSKYYFLLYNRTLDKFYIGLIGKGCFRDGV